VQIIFNAFRQRPARLFLAEAARCGVGVIVRVPLASGLLSGKYSTDTVFAENDHRNYNRSGAAFDVGETFSGVDFEQGLTAAQEFGQLAPGGATTAQAAIAWVAAQDGVSTVIPGARSREQARSNAASGSMLANIDADFNAGVRSIYGQYFRESVHPRW
jgi:aryl-alcohol dehydrogenase-like predicted oxidoreductase